MAANEINAGSYAQFEGFDSFAYRCVEYLLNSDEVIWKLLKYNEPDAWKRADLTQEEKGALIYKGQDDTSAFRVFLDYGQPDVNVQEVCMLRVAPSNIFPDNRTVGTISINFEVYCHYKINHLSNYKTRIDMISQRLLQVFNGAVIEGMVGKLFFDGLGSQLNRSEIGGQLPFKGRWIVFSTKTS